MKKAAALCLAALMIYALTTTGALAADIPEPPEISAKSCILIDANNGRVLFEKDSGELMQIASTTKILTALVVLDRSDPREAVEIKPEWTGIEGSSMYLKAGETMTVSDLLYGMLMESGNDAAHALACHVAGDIPGFSEMMNKKARRLGCTESNFENPQPGALIQREGSRHYHASGAPKRSYR